MLTVGLATSEKWPSLSPDDAPLFADLRSLGVDARAVVWSDPAADWSKFDLVVIRSCWDYHLRADEFRRWIGSLRRPLFNPPDIVRWNMHKSYLVDLQEKRVRIPRTQILREAGTIDFEGSIIVKPAVSASAYETHRFGRARDAVRTITRLIRNGDVVVQEFVPEIVADGEWSLVFIDREFSHAVRKAPGSGDFRVQVELGGSADPAAAPAELVDEARAILAKVEGDLLYARVDLVARIQGVMLMELELIEPHLFLASAPGSARRFAEAIVRRAKATSGT